MSEPAVPSAVTGRPMLENASQIAALVRRAPGLLALFDESGLRFLSPEAVRLLTGRDPDELTADPELTAAGERLHPDDFKQLVDSYWSVRERPEAARERVRARVRHDDGTWRHLEGVWINYQGDPEIAGVVLSLSDVTDRVAIEEELRLRLAMEGAMSAIARDFADRDAEDLDTGIVDALHSVVAVLSSERASVFLLTDGLFTQTYRWPAPVDDPSAGGAEFRELPIDQFAWSWSRLSQGDVVVIDGIETVPPEALAERNTLLASPSTKFFAVPLQSRDRVLGFLSLSSTHALKQLPQTTITFLRQFAALLTTAFERQVSAELRWRSIEALRTGAERFQRLVQSSPDLVVVLDDLARLTYVSPVAQEMLGYDPDDVVGTSCFDLIHEADCETAAQAFADVVARVDDVEMLPLRLRRADGSFVSVEVMSNNLFDDPLVQGLIVNVRDVSERERIAATLRESEVRFQHAWDHSPIGMSFTASDMHLLRVNPALCQMLGYTEAKLVGMSAVALTHPDERKSTHSYQQRLWAGEIADYSLEKRLRRADDTWLWTRVNVTLVRDDDGQALYSLGQIEDITERRAFEARLAYDASHDALTGLPTRNLLYNQLERALASASRNGTRVAALFIDLDYFKRVNDAFGHGAGDELLASVADRLRTAVRDADVPARMGGDEFVVVCPDLTDAQDVVVVAERIRTLLGRPFYVRGVETFVGASIGIAMADRGTDAATLLRQADTAAYRAKDRGRNRYEIFDDELRAAVAQRLDTEAALRLGLQRDEFPLVYQPVVDIATGALLGFEALLRWDRPGVGLLEPREFLTVAEETGLIVPLGQFALRSASRQLARWNEQHPTIPVWISVNLSARQLVQPELADEVVQALASAGAPADRLVLEFSETLLDDDAPRVGALLQALSQSGVRLALDDFGAGASSLTDLQHLPVTVLKIDHTFVHQLGEDGQTSTIVGSVVNLAHALGMRVVGESVETQVQLDHLHRLGCDWAQGRLLSPPLSVHDATALLGAGSAALTPGLPPGHTPGLPPGASAAS